MKKLFSILFKLIAIFVSILVISLTLAIIFGVTVELSFLKPGVEKAAKAALGRELKIRGPVVFKFANWTAIDVLDIRIANVKNATKSDFFTAGKARLEIGLIPLLSGKIHIAEIIAEDVTLNLQNDLNGEANWVFNKAKPQIETESNTTVTHTNKKSITFGGLDKLSFKRIALTYFDASINKTLNAQLDSMTGEISSGKPIIIDLNGHVNKTLFHMNIKGLPYNTLKEKEKPWAFELNGEVGGRKVAAKGDFIRDEIPEVNMAFGIKDVDVGLILSELGLINDLSASMGNAAFKVSLKGKSLKQILRESSMFFVVKNAQWKINIPNSKSSFDITKLNGEINIERGNNITMNLTGNLKDEPLKLKITSSPLVDYIETPDKIPLTIDAQLAKIKLQFASTLALPITSKDLKLALKINAERLDSLNKLFSLELPPIGPLALDANMQLTNKGYDLSKLYVKVGQTNLNGKMNLDIRQKIAKLDMELISDMIQINDFNFEKKKSKKKKSKKPLTEAEKKKIRNLLSPEVLGQLNANIKIKAKQVYSGKDKLGSASARVTLKKSRLAVEPLVVNIPGGGVKIDFSLLPKKNSMTIDLKAKIDKFDIGVIARRAKPKTDMGGHLYLDVALHSATPNLKMMMKSAKGHFDFGIVPKNFSADIMDLWAVNLLSAIMDKETEKNKSQVNCFIMRFGMNDGIMQDKIVYMDTTNMLVSGEAKIDFQKETIDMKMAPKAKKPEFFSLATPIKINGTFKDFGLNLSMGDILGTVISFVTSPIITPIRRIVVDELPSDGKDACQKAWRYVEKKRVEEEKLSVHERALKMLEGE